MAGLRELRRRVTSVRNTRKTTYAMKLVSAAKLRRTQDAATRSKAYTQGLYELLSTLVRAQEEAIVMHPLMDVRPIKNVLVVIIGGSRGLAGGYNANVARAVETCMSDLAARENSPNVEWVLFGKKVAEYFRRHRLPYREAHESLPEEPLKWPLAELCSSIEHDFCSGRVDEVILIYTEFRSALSLVPHIERVLPIDQTSLIAKAWTSAKRSSQFGDESKLLFEPSPKEVLFALIPRIFRTFVRQACLDAKTSEHASRMTAMDSATKNAGELIDALKLKYNKLRQSNITSELLDIIGGAEAVE